MMDPQRTIMLLRMRTMRLPSQISVTLCISCARRWSCGLSYYPRLRCYRDLLPSRSSVAALILHHLSPSAFAHLL
jgi:hypothetical protein